MSGRLKNKLLVLTCMSFVVLLVFGSLVFNFIFGGEIPQTMLDYDDSGKIVGKAPFGPSLDLPFGTDRDGYDMFFKVLQGAQYTLGAAIIISLLSFLISFLFGVIGGFTSSAIKSVSQTILTSFYFIPQSIIAYNILYPLLWEPPQGFETTFSERLILTVITLAMITVPTTAIIISNETREILKKEFIMSAKVLGGSKWFLFKKHLMPHLKLRLFIIFPKVVIQVLLIIAHLGFFQLFFGGTDVCYGPFCDPPKPIVQEWAGLMAINFDALFNAWWIFMAPMLFFSLTILSLNGITKGLENLLSPNQVNLKKYNENTKTQTEINGNKKMEYISSEDFQRVSN
jgi:peptide/nickel transport system permease protein